MFPVPNYQDHGTELPGQESWDVFVNEALVVLVQGWDIWECVRFRIQVIFAGGKINNIIIK